MVLITPRLVQPLEAGQTPPLPIVPQRFLQPDEKRQIDGVPAPAKPERATPRSCRQLRHRGCASSSGAAE